MAKSVGLFLQSRNIQRNTSPVMTNSAGPRSCQKILLKKGHRDPGVSRKVRKCRNRDKMFKNEWNFLFNSDTSTQEHRNTTRPISTNAHLRVKTAKPHTILGEKYKPQEIGESRKTENSKLHALAVNSSWKMVKNQENRKTDVDNGSNWKSRTGFQLKPRTSGHFQNQKDAKKTFLGPVKKLVTWLIYPYILPIP